MHFEILVEDLSGKKTIDLLIPKIIGNDSEHTFTVHSYKGIGRIPKKIGNSGDARKRILLSQLPKLLSGYGNAFNSYPVGYRAAVILVCDLDNKCLKSFRQELLGVLNACNPKPETQFCISVEEGEAWFLGDIPAIKAAYPKANNNILKNYINDSICGTWELLADAIFLGGSEALKTKGWQTTGSEKSAWAENITPYMNVENNSSISFCYFLDKIRELSDNPPNDETN